MKRSLITFTCVIFIGIASCEQSDSSTATADEPAACVTENITFKKDILPIFESNCFSCHSLEKHQEKAKGNLMASYKEINQFLNEGLILGNIQHLPGYIEMPHKRDKLPDCDIERIKTWVKAGALDN